MMPPGVDSGLVMVNHGIPSIVRLGHLGAVHSSIVVRSTLIETLGDSALARFPLERSRTWPTPASGESSTGASDVRGAAENDDGRAAAALPGGGVPWMIVAYASAQPLTPGPGLDPNVVLLKFGRASFLVL